MDEYWSGKPQSPLHRLLADAMDSYRAAQVKIASHYPERIRAFKPIEHQGKRIFVHYNELKSVHGSESIKFSGYGFSIEGDKFFVDFQFKGNHWKGEEVENLHIVDLNKRVDSPEAMLQRLKDADLSGHFPLEKQPLTEGRAYYAITNDQQKHKIASFDNWEDARLFLDDIGEDYENENKLYSDCTHENDLKSISNEITSLQKINLEKELKTSAFLKEEATSTQEGNIQEYFSGKPQSDLHKFILDASDSLRACTSKPVALALDMGRELKVHYEYISAKHNDRNVIFQIPRNSFSNGAPGWSVGYDSAGNKYHGNIVNASKNPDDPSLAVHEIIALKQKAQPLADVLEKIRSDKLSMFMDRQVGSDGSIRYDAWKGSEKFFVATFPDIKADEAFMSKDIDGGFMTDDSVIVFPVHTSLLERELQTSISMEKEILSTQEENVREYLGGKPQSEIHQFLCDASDALRACENRPIALGLDLGIEIPTDIKYASKKHGDKHVVFQVDRTYFSEDMPEWNIGFDRDGNKYHGYIEDKAKEMGEELFSVKEIRNLNKKSQSVPDVLEKITNGSLSYSLNRQIENDGITRYYAFKDSERTLIAEFSNDDSSNKLTC